jgi:hypothetical protein
MRRTIATTVLAAALAALAAAPAQGAFGLKDLDNTYTDQNGSPSMQAGSHPFSGDYHLATNTIFQGGIEVPDEELRDLIFNLPPGLVVDPTAVPRCSTVDFAAGNQPECPAASALGVFDLVFGFGQPGPVFPVAVYNLEPPPGAVIRFGFRPVGVPITVDGTLSPNPPYNGIASSLGATQVAFFYNGTIRLWGNPVSSVHDSERGVCGESNADDLCPAPITEKPFWLMPRSCTGPLVTHLEARSWQQPAKWLTYPIETHDDSIPPQPLGTSGCGQVPYAPKLSSKLTSEAAETGSGLDVAVDFHDPGISNPDGVAASDTKKAVLTFPEGVTINPSVGEGLDVCTPAQLSQETLHPAPGAGCPDASKLGTLHVTSPLVDEAVEGSIFLAQQDDPATSQPGAENPFDSLIANYFVLRNTNLGVIVKLPLKVEPDPNTGQLQAILSDIPQLPLARFEAHLRTGERAALVTPGACGTYTTQATFTPWANPGSPLTTTASFRVSSGVRGGPCPPGGVRPFDPDFQAGSLNNNAGSFSPFNMRLQRRDGEQDMTKFSSILPPGELGSLRGVAKCPDQAIEIARAKTGKQELANPSCPANSLIGHTSAGAGVGDALTYVGGQVYLGGPFRGDPLSVISITPAVAGPFDAGTVVVRLALTLNPKTAEVEVDGANSDPIPHILKGIVLKVRDLRVFVDRPDFTLNPTSCEESSARATLFGSFLDVLNPADDRPVDLSTRYQAANCLNLGFKPKLALNLKGGTKRGGHPGLSAIYTPRKGDANVEGLVVRLPRSAFLDQAHIRTICTRVQFAADACPAAAQYGFIRAWTPLLDEPLAGPVWLRSSSHKLPDLVFDLHGLVDIEVATRIDSAKGGIRASLEDLPDAPLSKVVLRMQGGKKGLIINSRDLCAHRSKAEVQLSGQNGKQHSLAPVMRAQCGGKRKRPR